MVLSSTLVMGEVLDLVEESCEQDPTKLVVERITLPVVLVTLVMRSASDLRAFCSADEDAPFDRIVREGCVEYTAVYDRSDRRMLVTHTVYPESPEWAAETGAQL